MSNPDYLICLECETPTYVFLWRDEKLKEASCQTCGNEDVEAFMTEEELEELASSPTS